MSSPKVSSVTTHTLPTIQNFLGSIRKLTAGTIVNESVSLLTDEIERRVRDIVQLYENEREQYESLRECCKLRNDEQIELRSRLRSVLDAHNLLSRDELETSLHAELNK